MSKFQYSSLDMYEQYLSIQVDNVIRAYSTTHNLLQSLRVLQWIKPKRIDFVDVGFYTNCGRWENKPCTCSIGDYVRTNTEEHWTGKPYFVDVALKLPVSSFTQLLYNKGGLYQWQWILRVITEKGFLEETQRKPETALDIFTYPVNTDYLTPETTRAALYRWLKLYCPKLNYNLELASKEPNTLLTEMRGTQK